MTPISAHKMINFAYSYSFISSAIVKHVTKGIMNLNIHSLQGVWGAGFLHLLLKSVRDLMYTKQSPAMGTQYPPIPMGKWVGNGYGLGRMGG
jgi:hypothetical protein